MRQMGSYPICGDTLVNRLYNIENSKMTSGRKYRLLIFLVLGVLMLATGLLLRVGAGLEKYSPLCLMIFGLVMALFHKRIYMDRQTSESAVSSFLCSFNFPPRSLLFLGIVFAVLGAFLSIKNFLLE